MVSFLCNWKNPGRTITDPGMSDGGKPGQWQGQRQDPKSKALNIKSCDWGCPSIYMSPLLVDE